MFNRLPAALAAAFMSLAVSACTSSGDILDDVVTGSIRPSSPNPKDRECLARAMFFESHRSSREGLIAVGSVVMNRVNSGEYPNTVCGVVGQKNQFAPGVMTRKMNSKALPDVMAAADAVLKGERHPKVKGAKFFHTAGLKFPYKNMHYVVVAGGNAFYEKRSRADRAKSPVRQQHELAAAGLVEKKGGAVAATATAAATPAEEPTSALAFDIEQGKADAIGAIIANTARPTAD